ncbi:MAG: signal peptidase I [Coriobacteriia bacterium]|nr:signal peptidase I [Coriobacteriia bacterium]
MSDETGRTAERRSEGGILRWVVETAALLLAAFVLAQLIRTFVVQPYVVPTGSMIPTIGIGDRVLANKFVYRFRDPSQGDIIVFDDLTGRTPTLIKRVVATEGQEVDILDGGVYVDGERLSEPYVDGQETQPGPVQLPVTIPPDHVWVMGDNRTNSADSRWIGPQPLSVVEGEAFMTYWPPGRIGRLR